MAYQKQTWNNDPNGETPITAERLNHIEDGIANAVETDSVARVSNVVSRNKAGLKEIAWIQSMDYINTTPNGIKYKAKAEQYTGFNLILSKSLEIGKKYTLSFKNNSSDNISFSVVKSSNGWQNDYDNAYVNSEFVNSNSSYSYTFTALTNIIGIMFICSTNSNADTNERSIVNIQLDEGSVATEYTSYLNLEELQNGVNNTTVLYNNENGTLEDVQLTDNISNYKYIEIFYSTVGNEHGSTKVLSNAIVINCLLPVIDSSNTSSNGIIFLLKKLTNEGTKLTVSASGRLFKYQNETNVTQDNLNQLYVKRVVGYKK